MRRLTRLLLAAGAWGLLMAETAYGGQWQQGGSGWQWAEDDGSLARSEWKWLDGNQDGIAECYYFDSAGNMAVNTWIDGSQVDGNGCWVADGKIQTKTVPLGEEGQARAKLEAAMRVPAPNDLDIVLSGNGQVTVGDGVVQENIVLSGRYQLKNIYSAESEALMEMRLLYNGQEDIKQIFLKDGWLYENANGKKMKLPAGNMYAIEVAGTSIGSFGLTAEEMANVRDVSMKENGDGTFTIYYTCPSDGEGIFGEVLARAGVDVGYGGSASLDAYKGEILIRQDGMPIQQKLLLETSGTKDGIPYSRHVYAEATILNPGQPVQIQYPSTEGYMTIGQYLDQIIAEAN